jgi:hypothetical protein
MRARSISFIGALFIALLVPLAATASAPRYIIAHGGSLNTPKVLADWEANLRLMVESKSGDVVPAGALVGRENIDLALFWGPEWAAYADETNGAPPPLDQANQTAQFYPATDDDPAVLEGVFDGVWEARAMPSSALSVLNDAGVPVTTAAPDPPGGALSESNPLVLALAALLLVAAALLVGNRTRARRIRAPLHQP